MSGKARVFASILRGSLFERRGRVAIAVLAIAIGTSVAAALLLVSRDVGKKVGKELAAYGPNLVLASRDGDLAIGAQGLKLGSVEASTFGAPARHWLEAERTAGRLDAFATLRYRAAHAGDRAVVLAQTDLASLGALYPAWQVSGGNPTNGAWVGATLAHDLALPPGSMLQLDVDGATLTLTNVAIVSTGGSEDRLVFVPRAALGDDADAFQLALARGHGAGPALLAYAAEPPPAATLGTPAAWRPIRRLAEGDGEVLKRLRLLLVTVTAVALAAALLCAMSTLADLVLERTKEIALLRAIGAGRRDVLALFAGEALVLGLVGGGFGLAIGIVAAQAIGRGVFGTPIAFAPAVAPVTLALGVVTALAASLGPVRHALGIEPAPVLRGE